MRDFLGLEDIFFDPQTSGGLLFAIPQEEANSCLEELKTAIPNAPLLLLVVPK